MCEIGPDNEESQLAADVSMTLKYVFDLLQSCGIGTFDQNQTTNSSKLFV
jgi:hypothetical protein